MNSSRLSTTLSNFVQISLALEAAKHPSINLNFYIYNIIKIYFFLGRKDKRGLVSLSDGSIVDEALLTPSIVDDSEDAVFEKSLLQGLAGVVGNVPIQNLQKQNVSCLQFMIKLNTVYETNEIIAQIKCIESNGLSNRQLLRKWLRNN